MSTISTNLGMILAEGTDTVDVADHIANNLTTLDNTFASHTPTTLAVGDAAAQGSSLVVARGDHRHGMPAFGAPVALGTAISTGTSANVNHSDHVHTIGVGTVDTASLGAGLAVPLTKIDVVGGTTIGAALADGDLFPVYDLSATSNRQSAMSRVITYINTSADTIHTATDIGAALADTDEILVWDASATALRRSAVSRINTYAQAAISGDVTISAGVSTIGASKVTSSMIVDSTIVNGDISASAAIAVSKLANAGVALALLRTNSAGNAVEWGSSGQIDFPAAQNASAGANTLDDYEEGTWTPKISGDSVAGTQTYSTQTGYYTKVGRLLNVAIVVVITAKGGTMAGNVVVDGFSGFTPAGSQSCLSFSEIFGVTTGAGYDWCSLENRTGSAFYLIQHDVQAAGGSAFLAVAGIANATTFIASGTMHTS